MRRRVGHGSQQRVEPTERQLRYPNLFIVGAAKAGTTALYGYLATHPDVFMSPRKEPHFFGSDYERLNHIPLSPEQYADALRGRA